METLDYSAIGTAIDTTFGRSSTPRTASYSVKVTLAGPELLRVSYAAIVNFGNEREMIMMKRTYADESRKIIKQVLAQIKKTYKELTGKTIKLTEKNHTDSLEILSFNVINPKRTSAFRCKCEVEIG
jgi:hypothetical protein